MKYQTITVGIHEKRANPHEMGHFDCEVSYTVRVEEGNDPNYITSMLQDQARQHVKTELDARIAQVNLEEERKSARSSLRWIIDRARNKEHRDFDALEFEKSLQPLEPDEQAKYRGELDKAKEEYWAACRERLNEYIGRAERNTIGSYDLDHFNVLVGFMPEAEQADFRQRMEVALKEAEAAATAKDKADEIPY